MQAELKISNSFSNYKLINLKLVFYHLQTSVIIVITS